MAFMLLALPAALTAVRETGLRRGGTGASPYGMCVVRAGHVVDGDITAAGEQAPDERGARSPGSQPAKPGAPPANPAPSSPLTIVCRHSLAHPYRGCQCHFSKL
jgi:hypothetical protein